MNDTIKVGTIFHCDKLFDANVMNPYDILWTQTITGCKIVQLLRDFYKFNISYVIQHVQSNVTNVIGTKGATYPQEGDNIDVYTRPMSLRPELLNYSYPLQALNKWRFGFVLRRPESGCIFQVFYSKPFTQRLWGCLYGMAFIITLLLYLLKKWETHLFGFVPEQGITYEMLMVIGAYCQHIPPLQAISLSRRTVYFVFFMFTYVIYSFYTSNLLSHLVNDKDDGMDLERLFESNYEIAIVSDFKIFRDFNVSLTSHHMSSIAKQLLHMRTITNSEGLEGIKSGKIALLSDYTALYPHLKHSFDSDVMCKLTRVDLLTNIKKFLFTSKDFKYKEQFKIGTLRALETGVLKRLINGDFRLPLMDCEITTLVPTHILQISPLLCVLIVSYFFAVVLVIGERVHYNWKKVWPYVN